MNSGQTNVITFAASFKSHLLYSVHQKGSLFVAKKGKIGHHFPFNSLFF
jgi:hypothetical protein